MICLHRNYSWPQRLKGDRRVHVTCWDCGRRIRYRIGFGVTEPSLVRRVVRLLLRRPEGSR